MRYRRHAADRFYGAVIAVSDLDRCRAFYEHAVGLGAPVVDSNFWVEFELVPGQMVLALRKLGAVAESGRHCHADRSSSVAWCLNAHHPGEYQTRLIRHGCYPQAASILPNGMEALTFHDPEGNPFVILGKPAGNRN